MLRWRFTLSEWFALMAVAGLLASPLLAVVTAERRHMHYHQRHDSCAWHLKQIALASLQYAADYDEQFPPSTPTLTWRQRQARYLRSTQVYLCGADASLNTRPLVGLDVGGYPSSYMANVGLCRPTFGVGLNQLPSPPDTVLQCEYDPGPDVLTAPHYHHVPVEAAAVGLMLLDSYPAGTVTGRTALSPQNHPRHLGGLNASFADGHVKWVRQCDLRHDEVPNEDGYFALAQPAPPR